MLELLCLLTSTSRCTLKRLIALWYSVWIVEWSIYWYSLYASHTHNVSSCTPFLGAKVLRWCLLKSLDTDVTSLPLINYQVCTQTIVLYGFILDPPHTHTHTCRCMHAENAPICLTLTYYTDLQEDKGHKPASAYLKIVWLPVILPPSSTRTRTLVRSTRLSCLTVWYF